MKRHRALARGAVNAVRSAIQGGVVPGAGAAFLHGARSLDASVLRDALQAPLAQILANSGRSARPILAKLLACHDPRQGFDAITGRQVDLVKAGIVDPWPVVRAALATALSLCGTFLGCDAMIAETARPEPIIPPNIEQAERARRQLAGRR
jgi:chaperonin GroEL